MIILREMSHCDSPRPSLFAVEMARTVPARKTKVGAQ